MSRTARALIALTLSTVFATALGGCTWTRQEIFGYDVPTPRIPGVYRATIQQGNVVTQEMIDRLKPGMTQRQVRFILGEPVIANTFRPDRWDYVYTVQIGSQKRTQQTLTLWFENQGLSYFEGDFVPSEIKKAQEEAMEAMESASQASGD